MSRVCIVGANRGIGLALTQKYTLAEHDVIALCRQSSPELSAIKNIQIIESIDINHHDDRINATQSLKNIDILLVNAGILHSNNDDLPTHESLIQQQIQTNAISPLIFCYLAEQCLNPNAKIMLMTSRMGSMADNESGGLDGYRMSKAALNCAGKNLAQHYAHKSISVFLVHPGYVQTDMTNHSGHIAPNEAADHIFKLIAQLDHSQTGTFWHANGEPLPW